MSAGAPAGAAPDLRARLEDAAPGGVRTFEPPCDVPGARPALLVEPGDAVALGAVLGVLGRARVPAAIRGEGTKLWLGNPVREAGVLLSTRGLSGIDELDAADGVVRVGAGTTLDALAAAAEEAGWASPLDGPGRGGTVGGVLATGLAGPRRLRLGPVRDAVLGLDTVLASGEVTRCGARVVKNVTGYDLAKLYVGSLGTLGVIERAWLRLRVVPASRLLLHAAVDGLPREVAIALALSAARRPSASAVALLDESLAWPVHGRLGDAPRPAAAKRLVVELAGDAPTTARDAAWLAGEADATEAPQTAVDGLRVLQTFVEPGGVRLRAHARPSALARVCEVLERSGARLVVAPVPGTVTAWLAAPGGDGALEDADPSWLSGVRATLDAVRAAAGSSCVVESLPAWAAQAGGVEDVFGGAEGIDLMRALKARFDPAGILNPGRFVGGI